MTSGEFLSHFELEIENNQILAPVAGVDRNRRCRLPGSGIDLQAL